MGPILYLIEDGIGISADATSNTITWNIRSLQRVGIEKLRFGGATVSLSCDPPDAEYQRTVRVRSDAPFRLKLTCQDIARSLDVPAGKPLEMVLKLPNSPRPPTRSRMLPR